MTYIRILLILWGLILLPACKPQGVSPFSVDSPEGSFSLEGMDGHYGPFKVHINGCNALQEAHQFQGSDSLVLISNKGGLDLIMVFKGSSEQASMIISVVNPGDSTLEIRSIEIFYETGDDSKEGRIPICASVDDEALWQWVEGGPARSLNLSESSILLLPQERIVLPPLRFFSHLCSDKACP